VIPTGFRSGLAYVTLIAEALLMSASARASESLSSLEEQIQRRAHELYVERGNESGSEFDDWLQAEEEIVQAHEDAKVSK
jgi:hypothetical protein